VTATADTRAAVVVDYDSQPVTRIGCGSINAFEEIYDRYNARAYRMAWWVSKRTSSTVTGTLRLGSRASRQTAVEHSTKGIFMDLLLLLIVALVILSLAGGAFISPLVFLLLIVVLVLFMGPYRGRRSRI